MLGDQTPDSVADASVTTAAQYICDALSRLAVGYLEILARTITLADYGFHVFDVMTIKGSGHVSGPTSLAGGGNAGYTHSRLATASRMLSSANAA